jgi:hypothetical protein
MTLQPRRHAAVAAVSLLGALVAPLLLVAVTSAQVIPPIAPPKPAVVRNPNATSIGTGDLAEALNFAVQGKLGEATSSFTRFKDDWKAVADEVRRQSPDLADTVEAAIADVQDLVGAAPPPSQSTYAPVFRKLSDVVEETNQRLGELAPRTNALRIPTPDLTQAADWARQGNLARTHDEFNQFGDEWNLIKDAVRQQLPAGASAIDAAAERSRLLVANPANPNPEQTEYFPALQNLLQLVTDANTQLASMAPAEAAPPAGPIAIRLNDLNEAVDWAGNENLPSARSEFGQFQTVWASVAANVRRQQAPIADRIEEAIARVDAILAAAAPAKIDYFPALQDLQAVVEDANTQLSGPTAAAPPPAMPAVAIKIREADLGESVDWASQGNVTQAKSELGQFMSTWNDLKDAVRRQSSSSADRIEAAAKNAQSELDENPPTQSQYHEALLTLQKAVADANAQLGN